MAEQIGDEGFRARIAEKDGNPLDPRSVRGQQMRLQVVYHLQTVFEAAQKAVVVDQRRGGRRIDAAGRGEPAQRLAGRSDAQLAQPSTPDQLLGLGKEFDFPDAAAAGLDVVAFDRDPAAAAMRVDLTLDRVDVLDRGKIEVLAPEKGLQLAQKPVPRDPVAGDRPSLDQRRPFPILADAFIIGEGGGNRHRRRGRCGIGAKPQIGAKDVALLGALFENAPEIARQADEERLDAIARRDPRTAGVVEKDQVDIARIIELVPAELSHAEDDQPAVVFRRLEARRA